MEEDRLDPETFTYHPIGVIRSPFKEKAGTPIQGIFAPEAEGTVEVYDEYVEGLTDIELFSHIYLLYAFDRSEPGALICVPFLDDQPRGVFATRAPRRPNAIGLSIVRILGRDGGSIRVAELDILDGSPLLDIKPYVPKFDCRPQASSGWVKQTERKAATDGADDRFGA